MASDINLLPNEQRAREQRELQHRKTDQPSINYSQADSVTPPLTKSTFPKKEVKQSDAEPASWWQGVLKKNKAALSAPVPKKADINPAIKINKQPPVPLPPKPDQLQNIPKPSLPPAVVSSGSWLGRAKKYFNNLGKKVLSKPVGQEAEDSGGIEVNLIPEETTTAPRGLLWLLIGCVMAAVIIVAGVFLWLGMQINKQQQQVAVIQDQIVATAKEIVQQKNVIEGVEVTNKQVELTQGLLDSHIYWTNFFRWLEGVTLPNIYYSGFMGDAVGKFNLSASAKDYTTLAQQLLLLQSNGQVLQVSVSEANRDSEGWVNFNLSFSVKPGLFLKPASNP